MPGRGGSRRLQSRLSQKDGNAASTKNIHRLPVRNTACPVEWPSSSPTVVFLEKRYRHLGSVITRTTLVCGAGQKGTERTELLYVCSGVPTPHPEIGGLPTDPLPEPMRIPRRERLGKWPPARRGKHQPTLHDASLLTHHKKLLFDLTGTQIRLVLRPLLTPPVGPPFEEEFFVVRCRKA